MATMDGMLGDVYYGDPAKPLPDWRAERDENEEDDIDDNRVLSDAERKLLVAMLGSDPREDFPQDEVDPGEPTSMYSGEMPSNDEDEESGEAD